MADLPSDPELVLRLDGFEGPLDLLLELARGQKVDLARISILSLVEQFLAIVGSPRVRLELAGDWLVMAAWLTWLKSRLLLPAAAPADDAEDAAGLLAARLDALGHVHHLAAWLADRPQLGHDVFPRGLPERLVAVDRSGLSTDLGGLVRGYVAARRGGQARQRYQPRRPAWSMADAHARLQWMLGRAPGWLALERLLPDLGPDPAWRRVAVASTLLAGLELARGGAAELRQDRAFGPILLRRASLAP